MKVFVVSKLSSSTASYQLICQLARIQHEQRKTVPVLVIDDRYNLSELPVSDSSTKHALFCLDDFLHDNGVSGIVANRIAQHMDKVESDWVLIDFGQHDSATCMDFIRKIARYNYLRRQAAKAKSRDHGARHAPGHLFANPQCLVQQFTGKHNSLSPFRSDWQAAYGHPS